MILIFHHNILLHLLPFTIFGMYHVSTMRRFRVKHLNKLRSGCNKIEDPYKRGTTLDEIYAEMLDVGKDMTGIDEYVKSWYKASQDRSNWPEIKLVTPPILFDNAVEYAKWLGVSDEDLHNFSGYSFNPSKSKLKNSNSERRERVMALFENVTKILSLVENSTSLNSTDTSMTRSQNSPQDQNIKTNSSRMVRLS